MVRISAIFVSVLAIASMIIPSVIACEGECRGQPVKFLADRYIALLRAQLSSLTNDDQVRATQIIDSTVHDHLIGRDHAIDKAIYSKFHTNCSKMPPRRSPNEICGSAKSIACFAGWDHRSSVFVDVHRAVERVVEQAFQDESSAVRTAMMQNGIDACPGACYDWVQPFQDLMLTWEHREHRDLYGHRTPNCLRGSRAY